VKRHNIAGNSREEAPEGLTGTSDKGRTGLQYLRPGGVLARWKRPPDKRAHFHLNVRAALPQGLLPLLLFSRLHFLCQCLVEHLDLGLFAQTDGDLPGLLLHQLRLDAVFQVVKAWHRCHALFFQLDDMPAKT